MKLMNNIGISNSVNNLFCIFWFRTIFYQFRSHFPSQYVQNQILSRQPIILRTAPVYFLRMCNVPYLMPRLPIRYIFYKATISFGIAVASIGLWKFLLPKALFAIYGRQFDTLAE